MLKSVNSVVLYVKDLEKSAQFYNDIGFRLVRKDDTVAVVSFSSFTLQLVKSSSAITAEFKKETEGEPKGLGIFIYIEVDDVDQYFNYLQSKHIQTSSEPKYWSWGNREFVIRDSDGYKLVFYTSLKRNQESEIR